ncbi:hypothetical protein BZL53_01130 [Flavobacterium columnare]|nr:hypothetical protein BU993_12205 [Flavobacterium columnare]OOB83719.1 hypothetical protein BZL53_01130 [Flavobacterium columnare]
MKKQVIQKNKQATTGKLIISIIMDLIGYFSYLFPGAGEFIDFFWAPFAGFVMSLLYKGTVGKIAGILTFIEEITPGLDFIPSFIITWFYEYYQDQKEGK